MVHSKVHKSVVLTLCAFFFFISKLIKTRRFLTLSTRISYKSKYCQKEWEGYFISIFKICL